MEGGGLGHRPAVRRARRWPWGLSGDSELDLMSVKREYVERLLDFGLSD